MENWLISERCLSDGKHALPGAVRFLKEKKAEGALICVLSDRSVRTNQQMAEAFQKQKLPIEEADLYTTVMAAIDEIARTDGSKRQASMIGGRGMRDLLERGGFFLDHDPCDWIFLGSDHNAAYSDYCYAAKLLKQGARLILTEEQFREPSQDDSFLIGPAAVAKMLEAASGTEALHADFPSPMLLYHAMRYLNATAEITVFAAADAHREIPAAEAAGIRSVLVTSAGDENTDLFDLSSKPDYVVETLEGLLR